MDELADLVKTELLLAMYASVDRMNRAIVDQNSNVYQAEIGLQRNLRSNFEELLEEN